MEGGDVEIQVCQPEDLSGPILFDKSQPRYVT